MAKLNLGAVTAYADAVKAGFTGTREEFAEWLANAGKNAAAVAANLEESKKVLTGVNTAGETQVKAVQNEGAAQIKAVEDAAEAKKTEIAGLDVVQFDVPQDDKTPAQKKQARTNIDAAAQEDVDSLSKAIAGLGATASGNVVQITDIASAEHDIKVKATSPDGTDLSTVNVKVCGKNLVDMTAPVRKSGVTVVSATPNEITVTATAANANLYYLIGKADGFVGKYIKASLVSADLFWIRMVLCDDTSFKTVTNIDTVNGSNLAYIDESYIGKYVGIRVYHPVTSGNSYTISNIQAEFGQEVTDFEEYRSSSYSLNTTGDITVKSYYPVTTIFTDTSRVYLDCSYRVSIQHFIDETKNIPSAVDDLQTEAGNKFVFGVGIDCNYETPDIPELTDPSDKLNHWYGLYDALMAEYPEYISKIDCDSEVTTKGVIRPSYMEGYPIYIYKFSPSFTANNNTCTGNTAADILKVLVTTGTHGDEIMAIWDMYHTMKLICEDWRESANLEALRWDVEFYIMPCSNPYGCTVGGRTNYNGVDLNRNMPTLDWTYNGEGTKTYSGSSAGSEYESKVLVYYLNRVKPFMYIDHHNCNAGEGKTLSYITSRNQKCINIASNHLSAMTRRWKKRFNTVFPSNDVSTIYGYTVSTHEDGCRSTYANEQGIYGITHESNASVSYRDGEFVEGGAESWTTLCATIATDGFINFLLRALKQLNA